MSYSVAIVLDEEYGSKLTELACMQPVWAWNSPANLETAERLQKSGKFPSNQVTVFTPFSSQGSRSAEAAFLYILDTVDQHHSDWSILNVIGVQLTSAVKQALADYGKGVFKETPGGFSFSRATD